MDTPPFTWPSPLQLIGADARRNVVPFADVVQSATALFGVLCAPDGSAVAWLAERLNSANSIASRIVIALYPSAPTTRSDLQRLLALQAKATPRLEFRVHTLEFLSQRSSNLLLFYDCDGTATVVSSPSADLGLHASDESQISSVSRPDLLFQEQLIKSLDFLWACAAPLTPAATEIPVLAPGPDPEGIGRATWLAYTKACRAMHAPRILVASPDLEPKPGDVLVDPKSGDIVVIAADGSKEELPSQNLKLPKLDELQRALARLADMGELVTVESASRVPPLETPVRPEWFGIEGFQQQGAFSQKTLFRVSPFDDETLQALDLLRRKPGELLPRFTLPLANGVRWMPTRARSLFEEKLAAAKTAWTSRVALQIGADVHGFVASRKDKLRRDANALCRRIKRGATVSDEAMEAILQDVEARLGQAIGSSLLPAISYSQFAFRLQEFELSSPWGQAHTLMLAAVTLPRKILKKSIWSKDEIKLISAMDVFGDRIVAAAGAW